MEVKTKIFRTLDANINRCREGIRTVEDIFRFIYQDDFLRKKLRRIRHQLDELTKQNKLKKRLLYARDVNSDSGKKFDTLEMKRKNIADIIYVNFQRAKEASRVMEELFKIIKPDIAKVTKKMRYDLYRAEKETLKRWPSLFNT